MSSKERLGWDPFFDRQITELDVSPAHAIVRIVEAQRMTYRVDGDWSGWAEVSGRYRHEVRTLADYPAVGDWVVLQPQDGARGQIRRRLERRSLIARVVAGRRSDEQVVAANVDIIFIVTDAGADLNPHRIDRYLAMVWDGGTVPVIVINKAVLASDPVEIAEGVRRRVPFVDVVAVSAVTPSGLAPLLGYLQAGRTIGLVGSSGVGKSTIVNHLCDEPVMETSAIRERDGRGRHTTTARHLIVLREGALLIDTPGMRELQLAGDDAVVDAAFEDIAVLAAGCRFADCSHQSEPGCAVTAAVADGTLDPDRLDHYRRLSREAAFEARKHDKAAAAETKRFWKQASRAVRALYKDRERLE